MRNYFPKLTTKFEEPGGSTMGNNFSRKNVNPQMGLEGTESKCTDQMLY